MVSQIIKTISITATAGLLFACSTTQGVNTLTEETSVYSSGISISETADHNRTYRVNGEVIHWEDLSQAKQEKLSALHAKIDELELQFEQFENELEPLIETIETNADQIEKIAELIEIETEVLDDIDNMNIKEVREASAAIRAKVSVHEKEIRALESVIREKEVQVRKLQSTILGDQSETMKALERYVEEIAEILAED